MRSKGVQVEQINVKNVSCQVSVSEDVEKIDAEEDTADRPINGAELCEPNSPSLHIEGILFFEVV